MQNLNNSSLIIDIDMPNSTQLEPAGRSGHISVILDYKILIWGGYGMKVRNRPDYTANFI